MIVKECPEINRIQVVARGCRSDLLDEAKLIDVCQRAVVAAGLVVVNDATYSFVPHGLSLALLLAQSHLVLSTWPEHSAVTIDLSVCGTKERCSSVWQEICDYLQPCSVDAALSSITLCGGACA